MGYPCPLSRSEQKNDNAIDLMDWEIGDEEAKKLVQVGLSDKEVTKIGICIEKSCMIWMSKLEGKTRDFISS